MVTVFVDRTTSFETSDRMLCTCNSATTRVEHQIFKDTAISSCRASEHVLKVLQVRPSLHHAPSSPFLALNDNMACNSSTSLKNQRPQPETRIPASVIVVSMPSSSLSTDLSDRTISKRPASLTPTPNARSGRRTRKNLGTETRLRTCSLPQGLQRTRTRTKRQLLRVRNFFLYADYNDC
jgi:hypothetical protein